jgi:cytochrome c-type biogenesis protein CcmH/NrfG
MRRDTLAFTLAGVVFGFVLGYMAAGWESMPRPTPVAAGPDAAPAGGTSPAPPTAKTIDPDELRAMEQLAARQPNDAAVRSELGNMYMDAQRWDDAIRWYGEVLKLAPENPDVRTDMGACYVHSGRPALGLEQFDAVLKKSPDHRNAQFNRGVALLNMGRQAEAADAWEGLLKRHPDDPQFAKLRGRIDEIRATAPASGTGAAKGR